MLGNCATGRLSIVSAPTSTRTIEITMATIGRLIKNFDIESPRLGFQGKRLGVHLHARAHLLHTLSDHAVAGLQSVRNNPPVAHAVADFHRPDVHFVIAIHCRDLIAALQFRYGTLRHQQRVLLDSDGSANFAVPAGTQYISWIGEQPCDPNRPRTLIYLAVREIERTLVRVSGAVSQNQFEAQILVGGLPSGLGREALPPCKVLGLADGEINFDGVDG